MIWYDFVNLDISFCRVVLYLGLKAVWLIGFTLFFAASLGNTFAYIDLNITDENLAKCKYMNMY